MWGLTFLVSVIILLNLSDYFTEINEVFITFLITFLLFFIHVGKMILSGLVFWIPYKFRFRNKERLSDLTTELVLVLNYCL